jgi:Cu/Ag efflux protein CusF
MQAHPFISKGQRARGFQTRSFKMMCLSNWISATLAIALMASTATAANTIGTGRVKSIDADNKTFILTDAEKKDHTFKIGDNLVVNRDGKETKASLKTGEWVDLCYDKGLLTWTVHYVLVREGKSEKCDLYFGSIKSYNADKKELTFTDQIKKDMTYSMGEASVRVNMEDAKIGSIKTGDHALLIVDSGDGKATLRSVMVDRAK